jgi:hypothetical protein
MMRDQHWPPRRVSPRRLPVIVSPRLDATAADAPDAPEHLGVSPRLQSLHGARAVLPSKPSSHYGARAVLPSKRDKRTRSMTELLHSLSESEQQPLSETSDDVFSLEMAAPLVSVPYLTDFRDVLKVIDARERVLQNIRTFLASMGFIRGSARSLPLPVLRRGRAKLAWLLARLRVHSTTVVELIQLWRKRIGAPLPPPSPRLLTSRQSISAGSSGDSPAVAKSKQLAKAEAAAAVDHGAPPPSFTSWSQRDSRLLNRAGPCFAAHVAHARTVAVLVRTGGARPNHSNVPPSFVGHRLAKRDLAKRRRTWIILGVLGQHDSQPSEDTPCLVHISAGDGGTQVVQHVLLRRRRRRQRDSRLLNHAGPRFAAHVAHARAVAVLVRTGGARPNHSNGAPSFVPLSLRDPVKELLPRSVFGVLQ